MRVLVADDQIQVRSALRLVLDQEPDLQLVGETADAAALLQAVVEKAPDVLLLDWELPGLPAAQLLRLLHFERPALKVVAMSTDPQVEQRALAAGAAAYLSKGGPPRRLSSIIQTL